MALVRMWRLESESSGVTPSLLSDGFDGTLSPSYPSNAPAIGPGICSNLPNSMWFDGSDDYVALPSGAHSVGNVFSFSAFVYPKDLSRRTIYSSTTTLLQWHFGVSTNFGTGSLEVVIPGVFIIGSVAGVVVANRWQHILWTHAGSTLDKMYVNGKEVGIAGGAGGAVTFDETPRVAWIGCRSPSSQTWNGAIRDVRIYDSVNSAADAWSFYQEALKDNALLLGQP